MNRGEHRDLYDSRSTTVRPIEEERCQKRLAIKDRESSSRRSLNPKIHRSGHLTHRIPTCAALRSFYPRTLQLRLQSSGRVSPAARCVVTNTSSRILEFPFHAMAAPGHWEPGAG
jgi:hypothetical protein